MNVVLAHGIESATSARGHVVVIDVLRAFTCAAFAFAAPWLDDTELRGPRSPRAAARRTACGRGAESIVLVSTTDEAHAVKRARPDVLMMGEVGGRIIPGFDFGNSPWDLAQSGDRLRGRTLVQRTGSGTQGVVSARNADAVYLGSLPVASATCRHLKAIGAETVTLLAMGSPSGHDGPEDLACRAFMAELLAGREPDRERAIREVRESTGGRDAMDPSVDWTVPGDLDCATDVDAFDFAMPVTREGGLLVARRFDLPQPKWDGRWPFDVATIVAKRQLGELRSDEIPAAAERLIAAGFVTDELCALVGLRDADDSVAQARFERSMDALGLALDPRMAVVVRSLDWAHAILDARVRPSDGARRIGEFWREPHRCELRRDDLDDWGDFYGDWATHGSYPPADRRIEARIRDRARKFIGRYG